MNTYKTTVMAGIHAVVTSGTAVQNRAKLAFNKDTADLLGCTAFFALTGFNLLFMAVEIIQKF